MVNFKTFSVVLLLGFSMSAYSMERELSRIAVGMLRSFPPARWFSKERNRGVRMSLQFEQEEERRCKQQEDARQQEIRKEEELKKEYARRKQIQDLTMFGESSYLLDEFREERLQKKEENRKQETKDVNN